MSSFQMEIGDILRHPKAFKTTIFIILNIVVVTTLLIWCHLADSMALTAYTYLLIFDVLSEIICLVTIWVEKTKPSPTYSFGYERYEVLAVFCSVMLSILGAFFIIKESIERLLAQPVIHTHFILPGTLLAFLFHLLVTYGIDNSALNHVIEASSSSWLQEHVSEMSETLCRIFPFLSKFLLPRINPFALIAWTGGFMTIATSLLIDNTAYHAVDTVAAISIAVATMGTMFPISVYTGKILLQTTPAHLVGQLDKSLREISTLDGVLECQKDHFWTLSFGKLAGTVHVRVRRDADEQLVLAHVYHRLASLVSVLTVQVFKDDWTRPVVSKFFVDKKFGSPISTISQRVNPFDAANESDLIEIKTNMSSVT